MPRRWLLLAVILSAPSGCDNVRWGGVDVRLQAPPPQAAAAPEAPAQEPDQPQPSPLPSRPLLLAGSREGDAATLVVVGEVRGDALGPLPTEDQAPGFLEHLKDSLLAPGTELILFSEGVRVGRLTVTANATDTRFCAPRAQVTGVVELVPGATAARQLLALTDSAAHSRPFGAFQVTDMGYDPRAASISMAIGAIRQVGAEWPASLVESRADIQTLRMSDAAGPSVAATFLLRDQLAVGKPGQGAWSLFVLGTAQGGSYGAAYVGFRPADAQGKGAPRYFSHLDWDGDGDSEVLLDVRGERSRWFASLGQREGSWVQTFQDPCGSPTR